MSDLEKKLTEALGLDEAPAAPAPTKTPAPTQPKPPSRQPQRRQKPMKPLRPPRPKHQPEPKNRNGYIERLAEAYEDEVHPYTQNFLTDLPRNKEHTLGTNPIMAMYGDQLSREGWDDIRSRLDMSQLDMQRVMMQVQQMMTIERAHAEELQRLAVEVTLRVWNGETDEGKAIEPDLDDESGELVSREMLDAMLVPPEMGGGGGDDGMELGGQYEPEAELTPELAKSVGKRLTSNIMTHGSAIHAMMSMHHIIDKAINNIDPRLLDLYNKASSGMFGQYWLYDIPKMLEMLQHGKAGSVKVDYGEEDSEEEPKIVARAICFPVLAQELSKGVAEMLSHHGFADLDQESQKNTMQRADDVRHEFFISIVGVPLWKKFIAARPRNIPLTRLLAALYQQESDEMHKIIMATIDDPEEATRMLTDLVTEPEEFDVDEWDESGYDDGYGDDDEDDYGDFAQ